MNITLISAFRNATRHIPRYFEQVDSLQLHAGRNHRVKVIAMEGDSTDNTREMLHDYGRFGMRLIECSHGKRLFTSTEDSDRLSALTKVMIAGLSVVDNKDDVILYIESDLIWEPRQVGSIIDLAYRREQNFDIIAPLIFAGYNTDADSSLHGPGSPIFYDIFVYRKNGERFSPFYPYHPELIHDSHTITEVDSVGSCLAYRAEIARNVHVQGELGLISFCESARKQGYRIGVAPQFRVEHP